MHQTHAGGDELLVDCAADTVPAQAAGTRDIEIGSLASILDHNAIDSSITPAADDEPILDSAVRAITNSRSTIINS